MARQRRSYVGNTICHVCKDDISLDVSTRSYTWAFGIVGVRWCLCSPKCARDLADSEYSKLEDSSEERS